MRHGLLNDLVKRGLAAAGIPSRLEPTYITRSDGKRPDGMSMMAWKNSKFLVWDVTCPDTLAPSYLNHAVAGPGAVANVAESRKHAKYAEISQTHYFVPVAVETIGAMGEEATAFLKDLGGRIAAETKEGRATEFLMQRVSVAVQRGNATCILGTMSDCSNFEELFYLV